MLTPPATTPTWATDAAAEVSTPAPAVRSHGWTHTIPPSVNWINWWFKLVAEWIAYLAGRTTVYATLEEAVEGTEAGDVVVVDERPVGTLATPNDDTAGTSKWFRTRTQVGTSANDVASDGHYLYVARDTTVVLLDRATGATVVRTDTLTTVGTPTRIVCDGVYYAVVIGNKVEIRSATAGTLVLVIDHGATVHDVCIVNSGICVLVGAAGTGDYQARGITIATGVEEWTRKHGDASKVLYACAGWGRRVVVAGDASNLGTNPTIRCLNFMTGNDDTTDGVSSIESSFWHSNAGSVGKAGVLAVDESGVYIGETTSAMQLLALDNGEVIKTWSLPEDVQRIAIDHRRVYVATSDNSGTLTSIIAIDKRTGARAFRFEWSLLCTGLVSDGTGLFVGFTVASGASTALARSYIPNRPGLWRRVDPQYDYHLPYRRLIVPGEE